MHKLGLGRPWGPGIARSDILTHLRLAGRTISLLMTGEFYVPGCFSTTTTTTSLHYYTTVTGLWGVSCLVHYTALELKPAMH